MHRTPTRLAILAPAAAVLLLAAPASFPAEPAAGKHAANRLARESSPYLLQHAHNPVDWFPWGPEAFAKARKENKLVFLSIGYSSCHWCHVMERESFANADVAKLLNDHFVCIKVDREERPDVDQVYMTALQVFGIPGGWPLSMFLTPDGKPIIGGTYWPPDDKEADGHKVRGFKTVLRIMIDLEKEEPKQLRDQAEKVAGHTAVALGRAGRVVVGPSLNRDTVKSAVDQVRAGFDPVHGGFGNPARDFRGTKFPMPSYLMLLLQQAERTKAPETLTAITTTLDRMARGGIYDQVGGGFHRYSTERTWTVPHFEKMLYDNAQLVEAYSRAYALTGNGPYRRVVEETLEFVRRELTSPDGAFFSSLDADSEGEEGRFYVWTTADLNAVLPDPAENALFKKVYGADGPPNFEGKWLILTLPKPLADLAREQNVTVDVLDKRLAAARERVFDARSKRPRPFLDTKVITAWNGQMIAGYAVAGRLLREPRYVATAERAADFILRTLRTSDGRLLRTYAAAPGQPAQARVPAYLDDYAFLVHGLLYLHEATGTARWLDEAKALTEQMVRHFGDEHGGFFYSATDAEKLFARAKDQHDGAQPSGNSVATMNLLRLAAKTGDNRYRSLAEKAMKAFSPTLGNNPESMSTMVAALDEFLGGQAPAAAPAEQLLAQAGGGAKRSDSVVKAKVEAEKPGPDGKQVVKVTLTMDAGWHVYANPVGNPDQESSQTTVTVTGKARPKGVNVEYPKGKVVKDALIGDYSIYEGEVVIKAVVERAAGDSGPLDVSVKLQACNDSTCLLPATIKLTAR
jgi:uncharacterized protein YyaL (SSP411 family)